MLEKSLTHYVNTLERVVKSSKIPSVNSDSRIDYSDFLTAFAIVRGIMEGKNPKEAGYDLLMQELELSADSVERITDNLRQKSFNKESVLNHYTKTRIKRLKKFSSQPQTYPTLYPEHSLKGSIVKVLSDLVSEEDYLLSLTKIGNQIKKQLYAQQEEYSEEDRVSPNYMAEINIIYSTFNYKDK
ncbi:hypothetical protein GOV06_04660 [Candidatus Woesearchaeota archaeon]|nr:hypothetical protein [Candidatus Woesearchaeota archaeon]